MLGSVLGVNRQTLSVGQLRREPTTSAVANSSNTPINGSRRSLIRRGNSQSLQQLRQLSHLIPVHLMPLVRRI